MVRFRHHGVEDGASIFAIAEARALIVTATGVVIVSFVRDAAQPEITQAMIMVLVVVVMVMMMMGKNATIAEILI